MSRTGSIADASTAAVAAPSVHIRTPAKRLDPDVEHQDFSQHVQLLQRTAEDTPAQHPLHALNRHTPIDRKEKETPATQNDIENTQYAAAAQRLNDTLQQAMLMLEQAGLAPDTSVPIPPDDSSPQPLPEADATMPASRPSIRKPLAPIASAPRRSAEANAAPVDTATTPHAQLKSDRATARESASNVLPDPLKHRDVQPDRTGNPDRPADTGQRARQLREPGPGRAKAPSEDVPVKVIRQETHLAPVQRPSPIGQIADAVAAQLREADEARPARELSQSPPSFSRPPGANVVRVLSIRLEPAELGTVSIRMRLEANVLELHLNVDKPATAELLRRDQGALTGLLRSAGYDVEGMIVQLGDVDRSLTGSTPQPSPHLASAQSQSAQSQSGWSQPDGRSGGAFSQDQRPHDPGGRMTGGSGKEQAEPDADPWRPRGVYV